MRADVGAIRSDVTDLKVDMQALKAGQESARALRVADWAKLGTLSGVVGAVLAIVGSVAS